MTDLIRAICEAENCGEIDLDTRDVMIDIVTEAKSAEELDAKLDELLQKRKELLKRLNNADGTWESNVFRKRKVGDPNYTKQVNMPKKDFRGISKEMRKVDADIAQLKKKIAKMKNKNGSNGGATVESVRESIFESELAGEITSEERQVLLDYLESKVDDYFDDDLY